MRKNRLAFCTALKDRFSSLLVTLPENIINISQGCSILVVDYNSKSNSGERWILSNYFDEIQSGKLVVFRVTDDVDWAAPRAKNLAHRLADADYLFNLDCDNFISRLDVSALLEVAAMNIPCHQWHPGYEGTYGRIGIPASTFYALGGYDEGMLPMGYQDADLILRASSYHRGRVNLGWNDSPRPIDRDKPKLFAYGKDDDFFEKINDWNFKRSILRNELSGIIIKDSFSSFRGRLNGSEISIDGFNNFKQT